MGELYLVTALGSTWAVEAEITIGGGQAPRVNIQRFADESGERLPVSPEQITSGTWPVNEKVINALGAAVLESFKRQCNAPGGTGPTPVYVFPDDLMVGCTDTDPQLRASYKARVLAGMTEKRIPPLAEPAPGEPRVRLVQAVQTVRPEKRGITCPECNEVVRVEVVCQIMTLVHHPKFIEKDGSSPAPSGSNLKATNYRCEKGHVFSQ